MLGESRDTYIHHAKYFSSVLTARSLDSMHGNLACCSLLYSYVKTSLRTVSHVANRNQLFHIIFSFTKYVSFLLLAIDLTLIAFLSLHAYKDCE